MTAPAMYRALARVAIRDRVARAIYNASPHNKPFDMLTAFKREKLLREAEAVLAEIEAAAEPSSSPGSQP